MHKLHGAVRSYAWGSRTALAELRGHRVPSAHPEAELWLGAHPADPAMLEVGDRSVSLLEAVDAEPLAQLGEKTNREFAGRLPFLLKLLAANEPLSLQAHPSSEQARHGFAMEEKAGVPIDSPVRNYRDASHKPELIVALSDFEALAGFRPPERTVELFDALAVPEFNVYRSLLADQPDASGLRTVFTSWITLPGPALDTLLPLLMDGCVDYLAHRAASSGHAFDSEVKTVLELGEAYPGDAGVLAALLLNRISLEPGQGLYLEAGNLHAYLRGTGVEIMANSDNVLRGGLTPKHVDVPELLRVLDFDPVSIPVIDPSAQPGEVVLYPTSAPEFALRRIELSTGQSVVMDNGGPRILLCTSGSVSADTGDGALTLEQGSAAWLSAAEHSVTVTASSPSAQIFQASIGC